MKKALLIAASMLALTPAFAQTTFTHVECGTEFTLALRSDSTLWACGNNANSQLGNSDVTQSDTLMPIVAGQKWIFAATGAVHALAISSDSTMWGWGLNGNGQLGLGGELSPSTEPIQINATQHWRYVSAGEAHTVAILNDGTLWATGLNFYGGLGTGDTSHHTSFVQIGTDNTWKTVSAGGLHTLGIKQDGTLWGWGFNGDGELGIGNTSGSYTAPTQIGTATDWSMVAGGFEFSIALKTDGTIWSSGFNGNGQLGRTTSGANDSVLTQIGTGNNWKFIAAGSSYAFAIKSDGTLWGWGFNGYGQLGLDAMTLAPTPTQCTSDTNWQYISAADGAISSGGVFGLHSVGFKTNAATLCSTGADYEGQLGNDTVIAGPDAQFAFGCSVSAGNYPTEAVANVTNAGNISIYPNPASDLLHIDGIATTATYKVVSMVGDVAQKGTLQKGYNNFSIKSLIPGVYLVIVNTTEGKVYNVRLVKE